MKKWNNEKEFFEMVNEIMNVSLTESLEGNPKGHKEILAAFENAAMKALNKMADICEATEKEREKLFNNFFDTLKKVQENNDD